MRNEENIIIGDKSYKVVQMPATKALKLECELLKVMTNLNFSGSFNENLQVFLNGMDFDVLISFVNQVLNKTECFKDENDQMVDVDEEFRGKLMQLKEAFIKVLIINFQDVFQNAVSGFQKILSELATALTTSSKI